MAGYLEQLESIGFGLDSLTQTGYRKSDGFCFILKMDVGEKNYNLSVACAFNVAEDAQKLREALQRYVSENHKTVRSGTYEGNRLMICYRSREILPDVATGTKSALEFCLGFFRFHSAVPVCGCCGQPKELKIYALEDRVAALCEECFYSEKRKIAGKNTEYDEKTENVPRGIAGAMAGGFLGAVLWVLLSLFGRIAVIAGFASAVAGYYAYKKLGVKMSKKGLVISLAVSFVLLLAGMFLAVAIDVYRGLNGAGYAVGFIEAFKYIPDYISWDFGAFMFDNIFGVISYIAGAAACVGLFFAEKKMKNRVECLA